MTVAVPLVGRSLDAECAKEPIHIPGAIQPHGFLVVLTENGCVAQASSNLSDWCGRPVQTLLGGSLDMALGQPVARLVAEALPLLEEGDVNVLGTVERAPYHAAGSGSWFVVLHRHRGARIVELENARHTGDLNNAMYPLVQGFLSALQRDRDVVEIADIAAAQIEKITGFGRVLVYRFDHDGHGHVIAESLAVVPPDEGSPLPSYLGQRFPSSDIPAQARDLYRRNRIRLIADADYVPAPLVPALHPETGADTDLTLASLRSVSPVHLQYMRNMGTAASMSMSIVVSGKLWGLISCHHETARVLPFERRAACAHIAQIFSLQVEARELQSETDHRLRLRAILSSLLANMTRSAQFIDALATDEHDLLAIMAATGAAIVFEGRVKCVGETPAADDVERLVDWLNEQPDDIVHTDHIRARCAWMSASPLTGMLAVSLSRVHRNYVIWFRPEVIRTVEWAGNPQAKFEALSLSPTLSPRESFATWTDTVRDHATPWLPAEIEIASEFRTAVLSLVLTRAEELANLAVELGQANRELENFSYTVSHDLRAPLRHIHSFAALLDDLEGKNLSSRGRNFVKRILASSDFGGRLVDDLLSFAQMGRASLTVQSIDMNAVVEEVVSAEMRGLEENIERAPPRHIDWRIGTLPTVQADGTFMRLALQNVIANAIKFTQKRSDAVIEIGLCPATEPASEPGARYVVYVKDNGAGFDMRYANKLFGVFQRLHTDDEFAGTGIGLAHVRRIMERHGGQVWAEAVPGEGATFFLALPVQYRAQSGTRETPAAAVARLAATGGLSGAAALRGAANVSDVGSAGKKVE